MGVQNGARLPFDGGDEGVRRIRLYARTSCVTSFTIPSKIHDSPDHMNQNGTCGSVSNAWTKMENVVIGAPMSVDVICLYIFTCWSSRPCWRFAMNYLRGVFGFCWSFQDVRHGSKRDVIRVL